MSKPKPYLAVTLFIGSLVLSGCNAVGTASHTAKNRWNIGPFTLQRTNVPASVFNNPNEAMIGARTQLSVGTTPPYAVSRRTLGSGNWATVSSFNCAYQPYWTAIQGPAASLLCLGTPPTPNRLILFYANGTVASYDMPVHLPTPVPALEVTGQAFGGGYGDLIWWVWKNAEPPVRYGSGVIDLATGKDSPLGSLAGYETAKRQLSPMLAPNDTLYGVGSSYPATQKSTVYRWSMPRHAWVRVGTVPSFFGIMAIADNGSVWTRLPATKDPTDLTDWYIEREFPGSSLVQKWRIHGDLLGVGPGYAVYTPFSDSSSVDLLFPLQHRTLRFSGLVTPVSLHATVLGVGEMGIPNQFGPGTQVVIVGKGSGIQELVISVN